MNPGRVSQRIIGDRLDWIAKMVREIQSLPLDDFETFIQDRRNLWSAESCLRRAIEAMMDLGRHISAKAFGRGISEYKEIATVLSENRILSDKEIELFKTLAGYRNRMVHFYHEISEKELFDICSSQLSDIEMISETLKKWINNHPEMVDRNL
ncbi:MAG: DUF86 domain-containing protein [Deltaproteobacteria bacterium]|nr:DUF86 domain-containing protein [Deltaproteobacteria bacterium]